MSLIRSDKEVAMNDLLVAARETVDHYQYAIDFFEDVILSNMMRDIVQRRESLILRMENAVRFLGDLPSVPDPDKETGEMIIHQISAAFADNSTAEILRQRVDAEKHLLELVDACRSAGLEESHAVLLDDTDDHITETTDQLCVQLKTTNLS